MNETLPHIVPVRRSQLQHRETLSSWELFRRGFYYGIGLWCSFMVINIMAAILGLGLLIGFGLIGHSLQPTAESRIIDQPDRPPASSVVTRSAAPSR